MTVLEDILSQEIIQKLGWTLLHFIWQAAVAALLLAILLRVLRKSTANLRYIIAFMALTLIVLLPVITIQLVPVSVPQSPAHIEPAPAPAVLATEEIPIAETIVLEERVQAESGAPISADSWKQRAVELLEPALPYIVSGWLLGVFGLSIWHLGGWAQLQRLRRRMVKQVDTSLHSKLKVLAERLRVKQTVQLMESALIQIPTVVGWLRPVILLPASALTGLSSEQLEAILAHELAHIKRFDYLVNMLQTVVEILGFYHPAVWWVSHKIRAERENCCDDLAVSISGDRVCYARALTSMEEIRAGRGQLVRSGGLAVAATGGNLFRRIHRLVGKDSAEKTRFSWVPAATAILLIIALAIPATITLTARAQEKPEGLAGDLIDAFRANRDKFECGYLAWSSKHINNRFADSDRPATELAGQYELWWDGKKIATKYVRDQVYKDPEGRYRVEKEQGGTSYDGGVLSWKPDFHSDNWLGPEVTRWRGLGSQDWLIQQDSKQASISREWSVVDTNGVKLIRFTVKNMNKTDRDYGAYSIRDYDPSKGYGLVNEEWYNPNGSPRLKHTVKMLEVIPGGWFPVEVDFKSFTITDGRIYTHQHYALDIERCSFNDKSALPDRVFKGAVDKQLKYQQKLQKYLAMELRGISDVKEAAKADRVKRGAREAIEKFVAAALAGDLEKAGEFAHPARMPANQVADIPEIAKGQNLWIMAVVADDFHAIAVSSVILGDHERIGPLVFFLDRKPQDGRDNWWVHDIDMETPDGAEVELKQFLEKHPEAEKIPSEKKTDVQVRDEDYNNSVKESLEKAGARLTFNEQDKIAEIYFGGKATDEGLVFLRGLTDLERLNLETGKITNDELANIAGLDKLRYLSLYETQITDEALVHLRGLTNLQELLLHGNKITDAGLENLKNLTNLHILNISHTSWVNAQMQISDAGMVHLKGLAKLRTLDLLGTDVTAAGLEHLTALPELETLILSGPKITDEAMETLVKMKSLKRLELRFTNVTDKGIEYLNKMPNLEMLNLASRNITDAGLVHIEALKQLKKLELRGTNFGDSSLEYVAKLPQLKRLDLSDDGTLPWQTQNKYTAAGLALLKNIKTLRVLWLNGVRTGDAEIKQLAAIKNLEELTLFRPAVDTNTWDIRDKILEMRRDLRRALPDTRIVVGGFDFFTLPDLDEDQLSAQSEYMKTLATGVTVELIGMCEYPSADKQWWQPDGSLLVNPPYDENGLDILSSRKPDAIPIEFAFRLFGNLGEPAWEARVKGDDQAFVWWTGRRAKDGEFLTDIKSIGMFVKSDQRTIDLRLGFSIADRPYEWVEFKNISVKPNFKTDMRVKGTRSKDTASQQISFGTAVEGVQCRLQADKRVYFLLRPDRRRPHLI
jgi:beta-lactamase regulating signal transducer with metallopeptidase domain